MTYDNTNTAVLFAVKDKKNPRAPDYNGSINVEGKEFDLAGWKKKSKKGVTYLSLVVQEPYKAPDTNEDSLDDEDDLPF